jgi:SPP1 gp7 family putative phage head morphogenesis protein
MRRTADAMRSGSFAEKQVRRALVGKKRLKRPPAAIHPKRAERSYQRELRRIIALIKHEVETKFIPKLPMFAARAEKLYPKRRQDTLFGDVFGELNKIRVVSQTIYTGNMLDAIARKAAGETSDLNQANLDKQIKSVLGIDLFTTDPMLDLLIDDFAVQNVKLIKTLSDTLFSQIEDTVTSGFKDGLRWEEISDDIQDRLGVADSRADFIARDQVSKLNGQLTEQRQSEIGVKSYIWRTAMDERVRDTHQLEGEEFDWDSPPAVGHPGQDYQCRCYAEPVLEDLVDDTDQ